MLQRSLRSQINPRFQLSTQHSPNKKRASGKLFKDMGLFNLTMNVKSKLSVTPTISQSTVILFISSSTTVSILKSNLKLEVKDLLFIANNHSRLSILVLSTPIKTSPKNSSLRTEDENQ